MKMLCRSLLALLLSCAAAEAAVGFAVTVHGSRKFNTFIHGKTIIASQAVTNATLCEAFGVTTRDYAVVFDTNGGLYLMPRSATGGPTWTVFNVGTEISAYFSESPEGSFSFFTLEASADADSTDFGGMEGVMTLKISDPNGNLRGVSGTVSGAATKNAPFYYYTLSYGGTRIFQQTP